MRLHPFGCHCDIVKPSMRRTAKPRSGPWVRNVVYLEVKPGLEARFIEEFGHLAVLQDSRDHPGFISGELSRAGARWPLFALTTLWESEPEYRAWMRTARPLRKLARLAALMEDPGPGDVLEVVERHSRPGAPGEPALAPLV
jgi:heme-degrading monooxygenase HmoA